MVAERRAELAAELTMRVAGSGGGTVALGGGCLVNRILRSELAGRLRARGFAPVLPVLAPPGDGGLSYGQAVLGAAALVRGGEPRWTGGG